MENHFSRCHRDLRAFISRTSALICGCFRFFVYSRFNRVFLRKRRHLKASRRRIGTQICPGVNARCGSVNSKTAASSATASNRKTSSSSAIAWFSFDRCKRPHLFVSERDRPDPAPSCVQAAGLGSIESNDQFIGCQPFFHDDIRFRRSIRRHANPSPLSRAYKDEALDEPQKGTGQILDRPGLSGTNARRKSVILTLPMKQIP